MKQCKKCGKHGFFLKLDLNGDCMDCAKQFIVEKEQLEREEHEKEQNRRTEEYSQQQFKRRKNDAMHRAQNAKIGSLGITKIADYLAEDLEYKTGFSERLDEYNKKREEKEAKQLEQFELIRQNHEIALAKEKSGDLECALSMYIANLKKHPDGTVYFDRPCIVLEKLGRYRDAIVLCDQALDRIYSKKMNVDPEQYIRRRDRLDKKLFKLNK